MSTKSINGKKISIASAKRQIRWQKEIHFVRDTEVVKIQVCGDKNQYRILALHRGLHLVKVGKTAGVLVHSPFLSGDLSVENSIVLLTVF
jgi:carbohydrate-binding DOMON domain-containing protein